MTSTSIGDMAHTFMLRRQTVALKQEAQIAGTELATGRTADAAQHLRGDVMRLSGIETSLTRLSAFQVATNDAAITTSSMQQVLANVDQMTQTLGSTLLNAGTMGEAGTLSAFLQDADQRFQSVVASFNTRLGEGSLFAGVATDGPALADTDTILQTLEVAISAAGAVTATEIEAAVTTWFEDPAGFDTIGYIGGNATSAQVISAEDKVNIGFTARDPAIRDTLMALSLASLMHRGNVTSSGSVQADLTRRSGELLVQSHSDRATLAGRIGIAEARIEEASTRNETERSALQMLQSNVLGVDPFEAATRMESAQDQLETLYAITARLSRLSLVDFL
jgi:flagellar hook-associated protein 3 FlgL